eukprot:982626-Amphidinium_carterae.1
MFHGPSCGAGSASGAVSPISCSSYSSDRSTVRPPGDTPDCLAIVNDLASETSECLSIANVKARLPTKDVEVDLRSGGHLDEDGQGPPNDEDYR